PAAHRRTLWRQTRSRSCGWQLVALPGRRQLQTVRFTRPAGVPVWLRYCPCFRSLGWDLEHGQQPLQFQWSHLSAVLLKLGALVPKEEVENMLTERLRREIA